MHFIVSITLVPARAERLNIMRATNDGFIIAEKDLALRAPASF